MPWSYEDKNIPDAVKFFKPSIQKKAIKIANAVFAKTNDEGLAIAIGIKKAKQSAVKTFKKTASLNWAADAANAQMNIMHQTQSDNGAIINPMLSRLTQPKSMKVNFSPIGKISTGL